MYRDVSMLSMLGSLVNRQNMARMQYNTIDSSRTPHTADLDLKDDATRLRITFNEYLLLHRYHFYFKFLLNSVLWHKVINLTNVSPNIMVVDGSYVP